MVRLDQKQTIKITVDGGRRTELVTVPPTDAQRRQDTANEGRQSVTQKFRELAHPEFVGMAGSPGGRAAASEPSTNRKLPSQMAYQNAVTSPSGGLNFNAPTILEGEQVRLRLQPVFQTVLRNGSASRVNVPLIPGGN